VAGAKETRIGQFALFVLDKGKCRYRTAKEVQALCKAARLGWEGDSEQVFWKMQCNR
jgi:hypothetical protein